MVFENKPWNLPPDFHVYFMGFQWHAKLMTTNSLFTAFMGHEILFPFYVMK